MDSQEMAPSANRYFGGSLDPHAGIHRSSVCVQSTQWTGGKPAGIRGPTRHWLPARDLCAAPPEDFPPSRTSDGGSHDCYTVVPRDQCLAHAGDVIRTPAIAQCFHCRDCSACDSKSLPGSELASRRVARKGQLQPLFVARTLLCEPRTPLRIYSGAAGPGGCYALLLPHRAADLAPAGPALYRHGARRFTIFER